MQQIHLSIPAPCHEKWDNMIPAEKGRFCNACAKQVIDFSVMSDAQVLNYFSNLKNENVCGRAYPDQLDRIMEVPATAKKKKWYWNFIALFLLFFSKSGDANAQKGKVAIVQAPQDNRAMLGEVAMVEPTRAISGRILDHNGNPVPHAVISVEGSNRRYSSGKDGGFVFLVNNRETKLNITAKGYNNSGIRLNSNANYVIRLRPAKQEEVPMMAGMMIVREVPKKKAGN